ncbi:hypothetical protein BJY00DRAFT_155514 [Aspergillus carlsbadensis]|nr:hypothetical protein BJY00DRAFT_155514 [Aspergillus carlsbadensis]
MRKITAGVSETTGYPKTGADWQIIHVYDIASHTWWKQQASGDAPKRTRIGFGTAVSISPDGSAFHITTYGGWGPSEGRAFEDVYVLSIPSFLWINATSTTYETNSEQQANWTMGRNGLSGSCNTYKGSQMIVLGGGIFEGNRSLIDGECRDELPPVKVLDLSTYQWRDDLDSNAVYEVPPIIYNEIGGNSTGGAFATVPAAGFADPTLASALQERVATSTSTPLPGDPAAQDQEDTNPETESGTSNTGAIAGGVVGGVLGLALLIAIFWLFRRHQKKTQQLSVGELPASTSSDHKSEIGELGGRETVAELGGPPHLMRAELQGDRTQVHEMPP